MTANKPLANRPHLPHLLGDHRTSHPAVVSITSVPMSPDAEYAARKRRYATMMSIRIACVIAAVAVSSFALLLSLALMVAGAVLPWCAVLIANDRLPIEHARSGAVTPTNRAIEAPRRPTVEL